LCVPTDRSHQYSILDLSFYDDKSLSLLLLEATENNGRSALVLLPTSSLTEAAGLSMCRKISFNSSRERFLIDNLWQVFFAFVISFLLLLIGCSNRLHYDVSHAYLSVSYGFLTVTQKRFNAILCC